MLTERLFHLAQGGAEAILWFLVLVSIVSVGLIFERWFTLSSVKRKSNEVRSRIGEILHSRRFDELDELSQDRKGLESRALAYGLKHIKESGGVTGLEEIFRSYALLERPKLERSLTFLATVGSNAPFVGLLGTVLGIMKAFQDLAKNPTTGNEAVMLGISEALVATAVGLAVAIPAVIAYNHFQKSVKASLQSLDLVREICIAAATSRGGPSGQSSPR
jgi:biopolymer transport protein ExbB